MSELLITNVEDVVKECEQLIKDYKNTYEREDKLGNEYWAASVKGSIIGIVQLLARITGRYTEDYFREIFPEQWEDME